MGVKDKEIDRLNGSQEPEQNDAPRVRTIRYKESQGYVDFVETYSNQGDVLHWSTMPETAEEGREMLISTDDGGVMAIRNKKLYILPANLDLRKLETVEYDNYDDLPVTAIGEKWHYAPGKATSGRVQAVQVKIDQYEAGHEDIDNQPFDEEREPNPFDIVDQLIDAYEQQLLDQTRVHQREPQSTQSRSINSRDHSESRGSGVASGYYSLGAWFQTRRDQAAQYFNNSEKGGRRKIVARALGLIGVGGAAYLTAKGLDFDHQHAVHTAHTAHAGSHHHTHGMHHDIDSAHKHGADLSLSEHGDTIEGKVAENLHLDIKDPQVSKVTEVILHNQGISWDDARHLPVGYRFNMPTPEQIEQLLKSS